MINQFFKFGVHNAGAGSAYGYGEYLAALAIEQKPAVVQSVDLAGVVYEAQLYGKDNDVLVFRLVGDLFDEADYSSNPIEYARQRWANTIQYWPKELDPEIVWTVCLNEPSKEPEDEDWIAEFNLELARLALESNRKYLAFGWSAGTPEVSFWENSTNLEFLELCAENRETIGISLHEYSLSDNLRDQYPYLIGRFKFLLDVCDDHDIPYPTIIIGEFGWREAKLTPLPDSFESQLNWAQDLYKDYPNILGAAIWTLGRWSGSVVRDLESHMFTLTEMAENYEKDEIIEPPIEPPTWPPDRNVTVILSPQFNQMTEEQKVIVREYQEYGFPINATERTHGEHTLTPSHDDGFDLFLSGNKDSTMAIPYPRTSGYDPEWIDENYDVGERTVVYLNVVEHETPDSLEKGDLVVDISNGNGVVNFTTLANNGVKRIILRATSGAMYNSTDLNGVDKMFWYNVSKCIEMGWETECYMFLNNAEPFDVQIDRFYSVINDAIDTGLIVVGVAIDCEGAYSPQSEIALREACGLFADQNNVSVNHIIYSGSWWWNTKVSHRSTWPIDLGFSQWAAYHYNGLNQPLEELPPVNAPYAKLNGFDGGSVRYWQFTSTGGYLVGHRSYHLDLNYFIGDEVIDPPPIDPPPIDPPPIDPPPIDPPPIDPPPTGAVINMDSYFLSPATVGYWMVFTKGEGTIDHQYQEKNGITYRLKGNPSYAEFEELLVTGDYIWRRYDTSPGGGSYYQLNDEDNTNWSRWCPRDWRVGDKYLRRPHEKWYNKSNCDLTADRGYVSSYLEFHAIHDKWRGGEGGIEFENVIELQWKWEENGDVLESYFLAPRYGYVGWRSSNGANHYCIDIPLGRQPMEPEVIGCLNIPLYG